MSMSMHALVSRKATHKVTQLNNTLSQFAQPIMYNGDVNVVKDLYVGGNEQLNGNLTIGGNLIVNNLTVNNDQTIKNRLFVNEDINVDGYVLAKTFLPGQIINLAILDNSQVPYKPSDINPQFKIVTGADQQVVFEYTYTPVSSQSNILIDFNSVYSLQGANDDSYTGYLYVGNTMVGRSYQQWINASGGGSRSGTLLPISGKYTNSALTTITISLRIVNSGNDLLYIDSDQSTWLKITEIGR